MSYFITPDLGLELADPLTIQAFETTNVNSNFMLLEAGIVADRARLTPAEAAIATLSAGAGRGDLARETTASPATLTAIADPKVGDRVLVLAPGVGIDPFWAECFAAPGSAAADWRPATTVVSDTKAHLDTFIAAWIADTDLVFPVGGLAYVTATRFGYRFTSTAGAVTETMPLCSLSYAVNIPNSVDQTIGVVGTTPYTEVRDDLNWHDPVTNATRITPTIAGVYRVTAWMRWASNVTGLRFINVSKNGSIHAGLETIPGLQGFGYGSTSSEVSLNGTTDYLEAIMRQSSGGVLVTVMGITVELVRAS